MAVIMACMYVVVAVATAVVDVEVLVDVLGELVDRLS